LKKIFDHIISFIKEDFSWKVYLFTAILMATALYFNYFSILKGGNYTFEEKFSQEYLTQNLLYFCYLPFYAIPYFLVLSYKLYLNRQFDIYQSFDFWKKIAVIFIVLCLDGGFYFNINLLKNFATDQQYILANFISAGHSFFSVFLIIMAYYFCFDYKKDPFIYGLTTKGFEPKPYMIMLGIMLPIVYLASTTQDFMDQYPSMTGTFVQDTFGLSKKTIVLLYEFVYLFDFINLELMMRGLMIIGMARLLGKHAVLPTTMVYLLLHFEKPLGEAIGSIFGGYILGIIALRSKSILGGFLVHAGIAALMELFAFYLMFWK
jgi:hypothetical protein